MKKKVLFVNGHMRYGGVERSLLDVLKNMDFNKYEVDLLLIEGKGEYFEDIPSRVNIILKDLSNTHGSFIKSILQSFKKKDFLSAFARLVFICREYIHPSFLKLLKLPLTGNSFYDYAIAYRMGMCTNIVDFAVQAKKKIVWWHHGEMNLSGNQLEEFIKTCHKFKRIAVVSKASEQMFIETIPEVKNYITIIPNMVDVKNINLLAMESFPNYNKDKIHFVTASRIAPEKHIENIIYTSELLLAKGFSDFQWHMIGDGDDLKIMQQLSENRKMTEHVLFEGKKANPYPYIKHADIYIHSSYVESQGLSILEAMALNTPCIITDNTGIRDYANQHNSIIAPQGFKPLANAIFELINDNEKYKNLRLNTKCPEKFEPQNVMTKIEQLLN